MYIYIIAGSKIDGILKNLHVLCNQIDDIYMYNLVFHEELQIAVMTLEMKCVSTSSSQKAVVRQYSYLQTKN